MNWQAKRKMLLNSNNAKQKKLIESVEGIADILVYETKRSRDALVIGGLEKLFNIIFQLIKLKERDAGKFEKLVLSEKIFLIHENDKAQAALELELNWEEHLIGFLAPIKQLIRIFNTAIESKNDVVANKCISCNFKILQELVQYPQNDLYIKTILREQSSAMRKNHGDVRIILFSDWYMSLVLNDEFNINYLDIINEYFFSQLKHIISYNQEKLFKEIIFTFVDHASNREPNLILKYGHYFLGVKEDYSRYEKLNKEHNIEEILDRLSEDKITLLTQKEINVWFNEFNNLKSVVHKYAIEKNEEKIEEMENEIVRKVVYKFKHWQLIKLIFCIGSYSLFKKEYGFIKYIWDSKQPKDADGIWIGKNIIPNNLSALMNLYLKEHLYETGYDFNEDRHGLKVYNKQYFILQVARIVKDYKKNMEGFYSEIEFWQLDNVEDNILTDIKYSIEDYIKATQELKDNNKLLSLLGFDIMNKEEIFEEKIKLFFNVLRKRISHQLNLIHLSKELSEDKITVFKKNFLESFYKNAIIRDILTKYVCKLDNSLEINNEVKKYGLFNLVIDRAVFFDNWHVSYGNIASQIGADFAKSEDSQIYQCISDVCETINPEEIDEVVSRDNNPEDLFILTTYQCIQHQYISGKRITIKNELKIKGYEGHVVMAQHSIPVFSIGIHGMPLMLILSRKGIDKFEQYFPSDDQDDREVQKIFHLSIDDLAKGSSMDSILKVNPKFLEKYQTIEDKKDYLKTCVELNIYEKYNLSLSKEFKCYKVKIDSSQ